MSASAPEELARRVALIDWADANDLGALWSPEDARRASSRAREELAQGRAADFRLARAAAGVRCLGERDERWLELLARPLWRWRWASATLFGSCLLGLLLDRLGGQQLNLLWLPLWPVLVLQLISLTLMPLWRLRRQGQAAWAGRLLRTLAGRQLRQRQASALVHWWSFSAPLQAARGALLLHLMSLGLSLGLVTGLYGRALGQEFVVGWQSTFLQAEQVQALADRVLAPAALVLQQPVPSVAPLRHGALEAPNQPAGTWLHLLALTVLLVALPRLLLAAWAAWRAHALAARLPLPGGVTDLHLVLLDPDGLMTDGLLAADGEVLSSPEGDRLFVHREPGVWAEAPESTRPGLLKRSPARTQRPNTGAPADALRLDASLLPTAACGWPAQQRQLRALDAYWPAPRQRAWQRLRLTWETEVAARERQGRRRMAEALTELLQLRPGLPEDANPQQQLRSALQAPLQEFADELARLYEPKGLERNGVPASGGMDALAALDLALPHMVHRPVSRRRSAAGGAASGAAAGLSVDLALGGLTLGAGAAIGAAVGAASGALVGAGLAEGWNRSRGSTEACLSFDPAQAAPALAACVLLPWAQALALPPAPARWRELAAALPWADAWAQPARSEAMERQMDALCEQCMAEQPASPDTA
ncbi:DUF3482 domain-containing protein [Inhella sp.]|uniref:DUF3482 domain-containing protein n=1 Tax=Inhella sp. TaxID=1921806 RepID=UPI0035B1F9BE